MRTAKRNRLKLKRARLVHQHALLTSELKFELEVANEAQRSDKYEDAITALMNAKEIADISEKTMIRIRKIEDKLNKENN